jgi:anthranilate phosphoribosyltransferase
MLSAASTLHRFNEPMKALIEKVRSGLDLQSNDIGHALVLLLSDEVEDERKVEFLTALHQKSESADEIVGFVRALMGRALDPMIAPSDLPGPMIDVCGTGGTGLNFFNVSTTITFILAAGGAVVIKHGNRKVTSLCGSADLLEELGVPIHLTPEELKECVKRLGLGFIFAPQYHPAFSVIAQVRESLALANKRTIFNLLGPLLNPARPRRQLIGVFSPRFPLVLAEALRQLGRDRVWVVHGLVEENSGVDDVSICGPTTIAELREDKITSAVLDAHWLGIARSTPIELRGGGAKENAASLKGILAGEITGAKRDLVVINAASGFVVAGLARDLNDGIALAREQIDSRRALAKLRALQTYQPKISA